MGAFIPLLHSLCTEGKSIEIKVDSDKQNSINFADVVILKQIKITVCFKAIKHS